jgi:hypothetical protein
MNVPAELLGVRYDGRRGHVESWFLKANEPGGRRAIWLRHTIFARAESAGRCHPKVPAQADAWAIAFDRERGHVATKRTVSFDGARFARGTLDVTVDGCELSLGHARGALETGTREMAWDLAVGPPRAAPIVHFPRRLYETTLPSMKLVTPLSDARAKGIVTVRRSSGDPTEQWNVDDWPAMIGHNWGSGHAHLYAWMHCNSWDDAEDLVVEGFSARVRLGAAPLLSPMATAVFVRHAGERFDLGAFEGFGRNRGTISMRRLEINAARGDVRVDCDLGAETDDLVGLHYPNPRGGTTYCLNTKLARARVQIRSPSGRTVVATSRAAALEIGTRDRHHGVRMFS